MVYQVRGKSFPNQHQTIGRYLGPSRNAGTAMSQCILISIGDVMPIKTLRQLTSSELNNPLFKTCLEEFDSKIRNSYVIQLGSQKIT